MVQYVDGAWTGVNSCLWGRMQDAQARQDFVLDQMQKEAVKVGTAAMAMPGAGLLCYARPLGRLLGLAH